MQTRRTNHRGMTLVEVLTVIGIIVLLLAILLPALRAARGNSIWAGSQNNLRQIATLMQSYSTDNREYIVPSQFDYSAASYRGKVRTPSPAGSTLPLGLPHEGTWTDILWTYGNFGPVQATPDYRYDSPDRAFYDTNGDDVPNVFRSMAENTRSARPGETNAAATPFGDGADEAGAPGYFAANDFFNARPDVNGAWWATGQVKRPAQSVYAVDSFYGEVIPVGEANTGGPIWQAGDPQNLDCEVDFRYVGNTCLLLLLDGSIRTEPRWTDLVDLNQNRQLRVQGLHQ